MSDQICFTEKQIKMLKEFEVTRNKYKGLIELQHLKEQLKYLNYLKKNNNLENEIEYIKSSIKEIKPFEKQMIEELKNA